MTKTPSRPLSTRLRTLLPFARDQWVAYLTGCVLFAVGASCFIHADLGTDPLDVFALGVIAHVPLTIGITQALVAAVCIVIWSLWNRRRPVVSPFFTFFFCGSMIDVLMATDAAGLLPLSDALVMLLGVLLCAYGSSLIIMSAVGIRAMDLLAITMTERWGWQFWAAKGLTEVVLMTAGWFLGGPVGVGTVCFLVMVDLLIQPMMVLNNRLLGLHNHGIPSLARAEAVA